MEKTIKHMGKEQAKADHVSIAVSRAKTMILSEFEKVCPTDKSFCRILKEVHDVFDDLQRDIKKSI